MGSDSKIPPTSVIAGRRQSWWRILLGAFGIYILGLILLVLTGNPILFPTVIMLGSFMVPVAFVAFFYDHRHLSSVGMGSTVLTFL